MKRRSIAAFLGGEPVNICTDCDVRRWEWRLGDESDPLADLTEFLAHHDFRVDDLSESRSLYSRADRCAVLLVGAAAAAVAVGADPGAPTPAPQIPDAVAVVGTRCPLPPPVHPARVTVGAWLRSWTDAQHAAAVSAVRADIARGEVYQVNVVGHRAAPYDGDPNPLLTAVAALPGAAYGGILSGGEPGRTWTVATASPECLVTVRRGTARTHPIKGTRPATAAGARELLADPKERAEHVMIVDLARNDLGRVAVPGGVRVETLYRLRDWCGLWQAESVVAARLRPRLGLAELLRAVLPGGSVTGAPKLAALANIAGLEPVGRGPAMGAFGILAAGRLDLGLTIRTLAAAGDRLHLWAGGGITWGSDPAREVAEAHAKAGPLLTAVRRAAGRPAIDSPPTR